MGYANQLPYQQLTLSTSLQTSLTFTTVAADFAIADFVIPNFKNAITHAYIDLEVMCIQDTSGANNYIDVGGTPYFGLWNSGHTTFYASNSISNSLFYVTANEKTSGAYIYPGATNLYNRIESGQTQSFSIEDIAVHGNSMILRGVRGVMRLYFAV